MQRLMQPVKNAHTFLRNIPNQEGVQLDVKSSVSPGITPKMLQAKITSVPKINILKKIPLTETWRFFIDGHQQNIKKYTVSGMLINFDPPPPDEFLNLTCKEVFALYHKYVADEKSVNSFTDYFQIIKESAHQKFINKENTFNMDVTVREAFTFHLRGWTGFEKRESGYLFALCQAFSYALKNTESLSASYLQKLHYKAVNEVQNINKQFGNSYLAAGLFTEFRDNPIIFTGVIIFSKSWNLNIEDTASSKAVVKKLIQKIMSGQHNYLRIRGVNSKEVFNIQADSKITENIDDLLDRLFQSERIDYISYGIPNQGFEVFITRYISDYENAIKLAGNDFNKKLEAILTFVQDLNHLHPFFDGHTRTFSVVLLNQLLMQNGFLPVILNDPNDIEEYSINKLIHEIIKGMKNTLRVCLGESIFGVTTQELFSECNGEEKTYFLKSISVLEEFFKASVPDKKNSDADQAIVCKFSVEQVVDVMFDLYNKNELEESLFDRLVSRKTRDAAFMEAELLLKSREQSKTLIDKFTLFFDRKSEDKVDQVNAATVKQVYMLIYSYL